MTQGASGFPDVQASFQKLHRAVEGDQWSVVGSAMNCSSAAETDYGFMLKRYLLEHRQHVDSQSELSSVTPPVRQRAIQAARSQYIATFDPSSPVLSELCTTLNHLAEEGIQAEVHVQSNEHPNMTRSNEDEIRMLQPQDLCQHGSSDKRASTILPFGFYRGT
jgi:hypothetical protein